MVAYMMAFLMPLFFVGVSSAAAPAVCKPAAARAPPPSLRKSRLSNDSAMVSPSVAHMDNLWISSSGYESRLSRATGSLLIDPGSAQRAHQREQVEKQRYHHQVLKPKQH